MKSFIIAGASRSGKTNLSRRLQKETGFSLVSSDVFISAFEKALPDAAISQALDFTQTSNNLLKFLVPYIDYMVKYQNIPFILDIYHLVPEQVIAHDLHTRYNVMFMGYPYIDVEEKLHNMRAYKTEPHDWTEGSSDETLRGNIEHMIKHSLALEKSAHAAGLAFTDTSKNFSETINKALHQLLALK